MQARKRTLVLLAILTAATGSRLCGIGYGLPSLFYHHDEPQIVLRAIRFGTGDFNPHFFWWPGILQMELTFASYVLMYVVERIAGVVSSSHEFGMSYFRNPTPFYLLARSVSLVFGLASIWVTYVLSKRHFGWTVAALAGLFLATNGRHTEFSRIARPESCTVFLVLLSVWSSLKILETHSKWWYILAGLLAGLAASNLYYGGLALICVMIAHLVHGHTSCRELSSKTVWRKPLFAVLAFITIFVLICPYSLIDFGGFRSDILGTRDAYGIHSRAGSEELVDYMAAFLRSTIRSLRDLLTVPLAFASLTGLVLALKKHTKEGILICGFVIFYVLVIGFSPTSLGRHYVPILPFLLILAALAVVRLADLFPQGPVRVIAFGAITALVVWPSMFGVIKVNCERLHKDTRQVAKEWIEENVPHGTKIVIDAKVFRNTLTAPLAETRESMEMRISKLKDGEAGGYGNTSGYIRYYEEQLTSQDSTVVAYDLWFTDHGMNIKPVKYFRDNGYQYIMINSGIAATYLVGDGRKGCSESASFYGSLDSLCVLVRQFVPESWRRPGPVIELYRIK